MQVQVSLHRQADLNFASLSLCYSPDLVSCRTSDPFLVGRPQEAEGHVFTPFSAAAHAILPYPSPDYFLGMLFY